ncbi:VOC family protein [Heliobacillus mobilis]|uniref:VOC family protein n=1 Tax=Heliobacterium mobile TaxID=28064 RepID=A0A6I3SI69_HELMO|nr:VOC family protein [Heliobacterium mobile]MTV48530.1 VOC family protein [Heliobacterium mobile]
MFQKIDHVAITVKDRVASIRFYEEHLGFQKYYEHDVPAPGIEKIAYLRLGDTVLELIHMPEGPKNSGYHFCLISDDFDGDFNRLKSAGIPIAQLPHTSAARTPEEEGWRRVVFLGPDEEMIEFRG